MLLIIDSLSSVRYRNDECFVNKPSGTSVPPPLRREADYLATLLMEGRGSFYMKISKFLQDTMLSV